MVPPPAGRNIASRMAQYIARQAMTQSALTIKVVRVVDRSAAVMCVCDVWNLCWCKLADLQPSHMHAVPSAEPTAAYFTAPARRCQARLCTERAALYSPKSVEHKPSDRGLYSSTRVRPALSRSANCRPNLQRCLCQAHASVIFVPVSPI